ncbi:DUF2254 domain-containing protein [Mucilaginibacter limnophilus]|uniref:DUF2254 domain-containing protein n=1 Tax=Mucilaginibacter limnophilus TaxID=1932778 RepID=A0A3S2UJK2_9SPHI|nr:DUF2254 domain-containing protein [Mucilaginibacter limnophilus]RVT98427.1 DUF2254 domain-containing protein [Mucilaginibacter limnophilus]
MKVVLKWVRKHYTKVVSSIAFYPAIIAVFFLLLSIVMLQVDFSDAGKDFKQQLSWLSLKDASTARSILTTVAAGVISLTVFSFSMVMIVLNQAASQMSNRILSSMIENRFQQIVLGFYIGTIVYSLFLLSTIRDISSGIYVPAISIYLLILLTIVDIFLFIYFLDYVTQTVKFETVIRRVQQQTIAAMMKHFCPETSKATAYSEEPFITLPANDSGYYQGFDTHKLSDLANRRKLCFEILQPKGTYFVQGTDFMNIFGTAALTDDLKKDIYLSVDFFSGQPIDQNPEYGFRQLAEVAIKALSPGINDPATAVLSINALTELFAYRLDNCLPDVIKNDQSEIIIRQVVPTFAELFEDCMYPIWAYGKNDRYIRNGFLHMLDQLKQLDRKKRHTDLLKRFHAHLTDAGAGD